VDVDEGQLANDFTGRTWLVTVSTAAGEINRKEQERQEEKQRRDQNDDALVWSQCKEPKLKSQITGLSRPRLDNAIARLLIVGRLKVVEVQYEGGKGAKPTGTGYQAVDHADHADHAAKAA
jgi:hypothetical protein